MLYSYIANCSHEGKNKVVANGFTWLSKSTFIGENVNCNGLRIYGLGHVEIGNNFHSGNKVVIYTQSHNYNGDLIPYDRTFKRYNVLIGDNVWLGDSVIIVGNVEIGEGAIVQAGSVVSKDIAPLSIAGGNPAYIFRKRDEKHYFKKKAAGQFH